MRWYTYLAYFFGGVFLVNAIPHFVNGVSGRASESTAVVNVLWASINFLMAYLLIGRVGQFQLRRGADVLVVAAGGCSRRSSLHGSLANSTGERKAGPRQKG